MFYPILKIFLSSSMMLLFEFCNCQISVSIEQSDFLSTGPHLEYPTFRKSLRQLEILTPKNDSLLYSLFRRATDGQEIALVQELKELYESSDQSSFKKIVGKMLLEILINQGFYEEAVSYFALPRSNFVAILASLPKEEFSINPVSGRNVLRRTEYGHALVSTKINGERVDMIYDTGADWSILSETRAKKLGVILSDEEHDLGSSTSIVVKARLGYIDELLIGNVRINNHHVLVLNDESTLIDTDSLVFDLGAVLGWNAIRELRTELNDIDDEFDVKLSSPKKKCPASFFWLGYPTLKVNAASGEKLFFGLDTGASSSELADSFLSKLPNTQTQLETTREGGVGGIEEIDIAVATDVVLH